MLLSATFLSIISFCSAQCWSGVPLDCNGPAQQQFPGPWDAGIYAPTTRFPSPKSLLTWPTLTAQRYVPSSYTLSGNGSVITYDFGIEVGGIVTIAYEGSGTGQFHLAFTESRTFIGQWSDASNGKFVGPDGYLNATILEGNNSYTMPAAQLRGGFRYMTLFLTTANGTAATFKPTSVTVELDFQPTWPNLRAYQGYFHSSDELLNRIWYAGAYTLQSNAVPVNTGRQVPTLSYGWANNATMGPGDTIIVDGAKRDRAVWPGDMGIAVPSAFFSVGDLASVKNALQVMYNTQNNKTGAFAESGPPLSQLGSDTYHMWSQIGTYNYVLYTNDTAFLSYNWARYQLAMSFILGKVDTSGLLNVTGIRDWARLIQGNHNTEANMILYHTLLTGSKLATWMGNTSLAANWITRATSLSTAINAATWYPAGGAYKDNDTSTTLMPQDANSLSLMFNVAPNDRVASIASELVNNWTPIGPVTPELPINISPFISGFELIGRFTVRDSSRAFELMRTLWGWALNHPNGTQSTLIEGYLSNGNFSYRINRGYPDVSYTSQSHGWSAGPTSALTNFVLGLDVTAPLGSAWILAPQMGNLTHVEGGFVTSLGKFQASWTKQGNLIVGSWNTPVGTNGTLTLPWNPARGWTGWSGGFGEHSGGRPGVWGGWRKRWSGSPQADKFVSWSGRQPQGCNVTTSTSVFGERLMTMQVAGGAGSIAFPV